MRDSLKSASAKFRDIPVKAAEIGVFRGKNALEILENFTIDRLYLIDTWKDTNLLSIVVNKLKSYKEKLIYLIKPSEKAYRDIPDNSLHFVYIDGNHTSPCIDNDIENFYKKVIKGGYLCGHDYREAEKDVVRAVNRFAKLKGYEIKTGKDTDWWIVK